MLLAALFCEPAPPLIVPDLLCLQPSSRVQCCLCCTSIPHSSACSPLTAVPVACRQGAGPPSTAVLQICFSPAAVLATAQAPIPLPSAGPQHLPTPQHCPNALLHTRSCSHLLADRSPYCACWHYQHSPLPPPLCPPSWLRPNLCCMPTPQPLPYSLRASWCPCRPPARCRHLWQCPSPAAWLWGKLLLRLCATVTPSPLWSLGLLSRRPHATSGSTAPSRRSLSRR